MSIRVLALPLFASLLFVAACDRGGVPEVLPAEDVIATVNGQSISKSGFDLYLQTIERQSNRKVPEEQKPQMLDQYIGMHLAANVAEKACLTKEREV